MTGEFEGLPKSVYVSVQKIIFFTSLVESSPLSVLKLPQNCNLLDTCAKIDMAESLKKCIQAVKLGRLDLCAFKSKFAHTLCTFKRKFAHTLCTFKRKFAHTLCANKPCRIFLD